MRLVLPHHDHAVALMGGGTASTYTLQLSSWQAIATIQPRAQYNRRSSCVSWLNSVNTPPIPSAKIATKALLYVGCQRPGSFTMTYSLA
jgi:hypothetical protein